MYIEYKYVKWLKVAWIWLRREKLFVWITKCLDGYLYANLLEEWNMLENKLKTLPLTNMNTGAFVRFFFQGNVKLN